MSCPRRFLLVRFHSEDLEASEAEEIREHLAECSRCRQFVEDVEDVTRCMREAFMEKHPTELVVPELIAEAKRRERSWIWRIRMWWWIKIQRDEKSERLQFIHKAVAASNDPVLTERVRGGRPGK